MDNEKTTITHEIQQIFINNTLDLLKSKGMDKSQLAQRLNMSRTLVYKYLSAKTVPSIVVIDRFARALNVAPANLLSINPQNIEYNRIENEKLRTENENYKSYFVESRKDLYKLINQVPEDDAIAFRIEFYNLLVKYTKTNPSPLANNETRRTSDIKNHTILPTSTVNSL